MNVAVGLMDGLGLDGDWCICVIPRHKPPAETTHGDPQRPHLSVICLVPCHQTTCGDLRRPPAETRGDHPWRPVETTFVIHLPCPLPPNLSVIHLPCPLPPNQSVICLAPCHQATHRDPRRPPAEIHGDHICQSFALPPATKPPAETHGDKPWRPTETTFVSHLPCPLPPNHPLRPAETTHGDPQRPHLSVICLAPCHQTTGRDHPRRSAETTFVSHLPCPLPPNLSVIHLPCPLPPNQSVICLAPCHQATCGDPWRPPMETSKI